MNLSKDYLFTFGINSGKNEMKWNKIKNCIIIVYCKRLDKWWNVVNNGDTVCVAYMDKPPLLCL